MTTTIRWRRWGELAMASRFCLADGVTNFRNNTCDMLCGARYERGARIHRLVRCWATRISSTASVGGNWLWHGMDDCQFSSHNETVTWTWSALCYTTVCHISLTKVIVLLLLGQGSRLQGISKIDALLIRPSDAMSRTGEYIEIRSVASVDAAEDDNPVVGRG